MNLNSDEQVDITPESEPPVAQQVFGSRVDLARLYFNALVRDSDELGLLGPREMPRLWTRHILNSAVVSELLVGGEAVADVGSGAGLPGIPLAIVRPDVHFTLIEPMERRAAWLQKIVDDLKLSNVEVIRARAEDVHGRRFDIVTARALSAMPKLLRLTVPLTKSGGRILALKGGKAAEEIQDARPLMKKLGIASFELLTTGATLLAEPTSVVQTRLV
jgi:16S rRNA (guanine527-N7)-methyltransferase